MAAVDNSVVGVQMNGPTSAQAPIGLAEAYAVTPYDPPAEVSD